MTSIIAFLIALTFGTANVQKSDVQNFQNTEETQLFSKDDGVGMGGSGGGMTDDPKERP